LSKVVCGFFGRFHLSVWLFLEIFLAVFGFFSCRFGLFG